MADVSICLQMIVKNEGDTLRKAILSVKQICDEIIIGVDNASTDSTIDIANEYADKVWRFDFEDDFAALRNRGIEMSECDWMIIMDGHEYYGEGHAENIQKVCNAATESDFYLIGHPVWFELDEYGNPLHVGGGQRLLRNHVRYKRAQHNIPDVNDPRKRVWFEHIILVHDRPEDAEVERAKQRDEIMPRYMLKCLEENPNDRRALFFMQGHHYSHGEWDDAIEYSKMYLDRCNIENIDMNGDPDERYQVIVRYQHSLCELNRFDEVGKVSRECSYLNWRRNEHLIWQGHARYNIGMEAGPVEGCNEFAHAETLLRQAISFRMPTVVTQFVRAGYYTWIPFYHLAHTYIGWQFPKTHWREALTACEKALEWRHGDSDLLQMRDWIIERIRSVHNSNILANSGQSGIGQPIPLRQ